MPIHAPVLAGQKSQILSIAREALRSAAMADTYQEALAVMGDALHLVAVLSKAEANHE